MLLYVLLIAMPGFAAELKLYFPFDEGQGNVTNDRVNGMVGDIHGAKWVDGQFGKALYFDGKAKECQNVSVLQSQNNKFLQTFDNQPFAITCWIKPDATRNYQNKLEILNTGLDTGPGWRLTYTWNMINFLSGTGTSTEGEKDPYWYVATNSSNDKVPLDDWNHLAVTRNNKGIVTIYLNGKRVAESERPFKTMNANCPITIGAFRSGTAYGFKGIIDEVKIYKGELSAEEIYKELNAVSSKMTVKLTGTLSDPIWQKAQKCFPFFVLGSEKNASVQTTALFTYDDKNLYFAFICDEPKIGALKKNEKGTNIQKVYGDDCVEVMVDADNNPADFYHIIVNPLGTYAVEMRTQSGYISYPVSNFRCFTVASVEKDRWIVEIAIPFSSFVEERIHNKIAFNCARNRRVDLPRVEESLVLEKGYYNQPTLFRSAELTGIDLTPYAFTMSTLMVKETSYKDGKIQAKLVSEIRNNSKKQQDLAVSLAQEKLGVLALVNVSLKPEETQELTFGFPIPEAGVYDMKLQARDKQCVRYDATFPVKLTFAPIELEVITPFYRNSIYTTETIQEIKVKCRICLAEEACNKSEIILSLMNAQNKEVTQKIFSWVGKEMSLDMPIPTLADGAYTLVCRVRKQNAILAEQKTLIYKLPPARGNEVRIDENLNVVINGKPFFPIIWWTGNKDFAEIAQTGSNGFVIYFDKKTYPSTMEELKTLNHYAAVAFPMKFRDNQNVLTQDDKAYFIEAVNIMKDHPAFLAYYLCDEPEGMAYDPRVLEETYDLIRSLDPYHPILICNNSVQGIYTYKDALDMFFPDPYVSPLKDGKLTHPMTYISTFMDEASRAGEGKKFIGNTPQVFNFGDFGALNNRAPTFTEERCMQYLAIIHGAKALSYYSYGNAVRYADLQIGMPYLIKEINSLSTVILTGNTVPGGKTSTQDIHTLLKNVGKDWYLLAANVTDKPLTPEITLPESVKEVKVISEARRLECPGAVITDTFTPYEVHLYTTNLDFPDEISLSDIKKNILENRPLFEKKYRGNKFTR
jgi:hypothetical protein